MFAIAVDDQELSLDILMLQLNAVNFFDEIKGFTDPTEAVSYAKTHEIDVAFLDIVMDKVDGISLAGAIRTYQPGCHIIFTTASEDFALDAFKVHASGYLVKPVTKEAVREQLDAIYAHRAKQPEGKQKASPSKCLRVQCFGNFEAFDAAGKPLSFKYKKSKELLAYLVHRKGSVCTNAELAAVLYEDRGDSESLQSQIRNLIADVNRTLKEADASAAFYRERGGTAIVPGEIACDYYDYLENGTPSFHGEYMSRYEWGDVVTAYLDEQSRKSR